MINQIFDKFISLLGMTFFISDLFFPVWLIGIIVILKKKGWESWKAWCIASTFCLLQAYFVAKFIGWNLGAYSLIWAGSLASSLFYDLPPSTSITSYLTPFQLWLEFWVAPPVIIVIIPTLVIYIVSKIIKTYAAKKITV
jgi:hypothetical protein